MKLPLPVVIAIIAIGTLISPITWDSYESDRLLKSVINEIVNESDAASLDIKSGVSYQASDFSKKYELLIKDSDVFWGHLYQVKFDNGSLYSFKVSPKIIGRGLVSVLNRK